jgi:6-phosphogluconolactonase
MKSINIYQKEMEEEVINYIRQNLHPNFSLAISGGNSPMSLFSLMKDSLNTEELDNIKFFWVDERMVKEEDSQSNYGNFKRLMVPKVKSLHLFPIYYHNDTAFSVKEYEQTLKENLNFSNKAPVFDLILLGLGNDGHTASLFSTDSLNNSQIVLETYNKASGQERVTLSLKTINNAKARIFFIKGEDKKQIVKDVLVDKNINYPASFVTSINTYWALDEKAASLI